MTLPAIELLLYKRLVVDYEIERRIRASSCTDPSCGLTLKSVLLILR